MAGEGVLYGFVLDEVWAPFVYCVVCQMHIQVRFIIFIEVLIRNSGQPHQSLLKPKHLQRHQTLHKNINPQIKLTPLNQIRISNILLYNFRLLTLQ